MEAENELASKYALRSVPRYTSYPTLPLWKISPYENDWFDKLNQVNHYQIYIHIPFCRSLCHYCGCYRVSGEFGQSDIDRYINDLGREWELYLKKIDFTNKTLSIHIGGGTPNTLTPSQIAKILSCFEQFLSPTSLNSIELDPRITSLDHLKVLSSYKFKKLSFGVQDFDPTVQKIIGRIQGPEIVTKVMEWSRKLDFTSINFDLIYGLPGQTKKSIAKTISKIANSSTLPDTIAYFGYAHVPWHAKGQQLLKDGNIPIPEGLEKWNLKEEAFNMLASLKYHKIGIDHFVMPYDPLYKALVNKQLIRNFMGYSVMVDPLSAIIGLGCSSISSAANAYFIQNEKNLDLYHQRISIGELAIIKGHTLNELEQITNKLIQSIMCYQEIAPAELLSTYFDLLEKHRPDDVSSVHSQISELAINQLIEVNDETLVKITPLGRKFLRNIASAFDYLLFSPLSNSPKFSSSI